MSYRYALLDEDHSDLSPGAVLHSAPGFPAFPVRLASEMFLRARAIQSSGPASVWDPCCGSGYLLTVLSFLHRAGLRSVFGSDVDVAALAVAERNLALVSEGGLAARSEELLHRAALFDKPSYAAASAAAQRLCRALEAAGGSLPHATAVADVFDPGRLHTALDGRRPDLVITDVPYGERTAWAGPLCGTGIAGMLRSLATVLDGDAVIAIATRGRKAPASGRARPLSWFRVGTRVVALFRAREIGDGTSRPDSVERADASLGLGAHPLVSPQGGEP